MKVSRYAAIVVGGTTDPLLLQQSRQPTQKPASVVYKRGREEGLRESFGSCSQAFPHVVTAEDVAHTVVFLASDQAASITGHNIAVDCAQLTGWKGASLWTTGFCTLHSTGVTP